MKCVKLVLINLLFSLSLIWSLSIKAEGMDSAKAKQECQKLTPQKKMLAKNAGYDLDMLCSSLGNNNDAPDKKEMKPLVIKSRDELKEEEDIKEVNVAKEQLAIEKVQLKPFGYDLFAGVPTTFAPVNFVPVPSEYVIGPGDEIKIQLFGKTSGQFSLFVGRDGSINFPELGPIGVIGLSYSEMKELLLFRIKQQMIGVSASITLGELRSIQIFILGEAYRPGAFTISSLSTMTNALFVSGGVKTIGSLRNIQLKRKGVVVNNLDLYDLLIDGNTANDAKLMPGDVIFIPPVGKTAAIEGAIKRPAIYEIKEEKTVGELVNLAGGYRTTAFKKGSRLTRVSNNGFTNVFDIDLSSEEGNSHLLKAGDIVNVTERLEIKRNVINLQGHFFRPGEIAWREGLRVADVIDPSTMLEDMPQMERVLLVRRTWPLRKVEILSFSLKDAVLDNNSPSNLLLKPNDTIIVFGSNLPRDKLITPILEQLQLQSTNNERAQIASITGQVRFPGEYPISKDMVISELVQLAGGLTEGAYLLESEVTRIELDNPEVSAISHQNFSLKSNEIYSFKVKSHDNVYIKMLPEFREYQTVNIYGEVKFPGTYQIKRGEKLSQIMMRAGGVTEYAHLDAAVFTREGLKEREAEQLKELGKRLKGDLAAAQLEKTNVGKSTDTKSMSAVLEALDKTEALGRLVIDLKSLLLSNTSDIALADGDKLYIPPFRQEVSVVGEVQYPTSHLYDAQLSFEEYIEKSGGETAKSDSDRIYIVKADGSVLLPNQSGWITSSGITVQPGDTIVVPLDIDRADSLSLWTQVSQVVYQLALGAAAVKSL